MLGLGRGRGARTAGAAGATSGTRTALVVTGSAMFGVAYLPTCAGVGREMCIPFAGPFLYTARLVRDDRENQAECGDCDGIVPPVFAYGALTGLGLLQLTGAGFVTFGLLLPEKKPAKSAAFVTIAPAFTGTSAHVSALGVF